VNIHTIFHLTSLSFSKIVLKNLSRGLTLGTSLIFLFAGCSNEQSPNLSPEVAQKMAEENPLDAEAIAENPDPVPHLQSDLKNLCVTANSFSWTSDLAADSEAFNQLVFSQMVSKKIPKEFQAILDSPAHTRSATFKDLLKKNGIPSTPCERLLQYLENDQTS